MPKNSSKPLNRSRLWRYGSSFVAGLMILILCFSLTSRDTFAQTPPDSQNTPGDQTQLQYTDEDGFKVDEAFTAEEKAQLLELAKGGLSEDEIKQIKAIAAQKVRDYVPIAIERLDQKTQKTADTRLFWVFLVIVIGMPVLAFIGFMVYPLVVRKKIAQRVPNVKLGSLYKFYLPQALVVTVILLVLGSALWGIQFLNGRILGGISNPQVVLQREALNNLIDQSDQLVEDYTTMFVSLADNLNTADPDKAAFDLILDNANQLKQDPLVNFTSDAVGFVMPFLNYISLVSFLVLLLLFLMRIRPDVMRMLTYPVDVMEAEHYKKKLPDFDSRAAGIISAKENSSLTMREIAKKLMWTEVKVLAFFAVAITVVAFLMSLALVFFFNPIAAMLMETVNAGVDNFLQADGASGFLSFTMLVMMLFVVECVVVMLITFIMVLSRLQDVLRQRFAGKISWTQVRTYIQKVLLRFVWLLAVITVLGFGLPYLVDFGINQLIEHNSKGQEPNWGLVLLVIPISLMVAFNLLFWLLRGFKMMAKLIKVTAAMEFNLPKPGVKKDLGNLPKPTPLG
ncbi:MAG: hypothetical protein HXX08_22365 [Chloroflexi bacterium]|uniref:Uncharacterized protein n=1 Tax=Candidatus Chlorohelix allophototropha TaxID=3003348 RepID=A0A8T7M9D2_9CHLR|nr:hypothetical protein [Chloroflexota bacterium]WJW68543.1 hypothetical protein OZ401_004157 [Chloroflexota bacterium L227-S17]